MTTPPTTPRIRLEVADAVELAELLALLGQWMDQEPDQAERWLARVTGAVTSAGGQDGYPLAALRADLDRFTFLLTGDTVDPDAAMRLIEGNPTCGPSRSVHP